MVGKSSNVFNEDSIGEYKGFIMYFVLENQERELGGIDRGQVVFGIFFIVLSF